MARQLLPSYDSRHKEWRDGSAGTSTDVRHFNELDEHLEARRGRHRLPTMDMSPIIGSDTDAILWWQMVIRGVLIFLYGVLLVRLAPVRIFGRLGAFDIILAVILGSVLSRAMTGNAPFFPSMAAAGALVLLHSVLAVLSAYSPKIGYLVKGEPVRIVADGEVDRKAMHRTALGEGDLDLALRAHGLTSRSRIEAAYLERNGRITVVKQKRPS